jgi:hypothetical protein
MSQGVGVKPSIAAHIPPAVQRAIGHGFKRILTTIQERYGVTEEDCLMVMLALVYGYATAGGLTKDQLSTLAFNVWQVHDTAQKRPG